MGVVRSHDRRVDRAAGRLRPRRRHAQPADLADNIGAYLWSAVTAEKLGIIRHRETVDRPTRTIGTLERMERGDGGQYFNWYDIRTGALYPTSPGGDDTLYGDTDSDRIDGGNGKDSLYGDDGDDDLRGDGGRDVVSGGPGTDQLDAETAEQG